MTSGGGGSPIGATRGAAVPIAATCGAVPPPIPPIPGAPPGGGSGIGRAVCVRLARDGARVAVADRDGGWAGEVREGLSPTPPPLHAAFAVDVASQDSVDAMVARVQVGGRCARLPPCPPFTPYARWPHMPIDPIDPISLCPH